MAAASCGGGRLCAEPGAMIDRSLVITNGAAVDELKLNTQVVHLVTPETNSA